ESLADMAAVFGGDRRATVAREITKLHEEFRAGALDALAAEFGAREVKGEIVVLVDPPAAAKAAAEDIDSLLATALLSMPVRDAASMVAAATGAPRRDVYRRALALKKP
ncbi:MAG: rRNA (cytidine-2'-O-)-methyltransferase, partial [Parvularculaceae bacterium]|nr:rRNA (cytidine-2'-O-)-methyltransferase [Parvularculaceae bacterium]